MPEESTDDYYVHNFQGKYFKFPLKFDGQRLSPVGAFARARKDNLVQVFDGNDVDPGDRERVVARRLDEWKKIHRAQQENPLYMAGQWLKRRGSELLNDERYRVPEDTPLYKLPVTPNWYLNDIPQGVGSLIGTLAPGLATGTPAKVLANRGVKKIEKSLTDGTIDVNTIRSLFKPGGSLGERKRRAGKQAAAAGIAGSAVGASAMSYDQIFEEAQQFSINNPHLVLSPSEEHQMATFFGVLAGLTEIAPLPTLLRKPMDRETASRLKTIALNGAKALSSGGIEGFSEVAGNIVRGIPAQRYDEGRSLLDGAGREGATGGAVGLVLDLLGQVGGRRYRTNIKTPKPPKKTGDEGQQTGDTPAPDDGAPPPPDDGAEPAPELPPSPLEQATGTTIDKEVGQAIVNDPSEMEGQDPDADVPLDPKTGEPVGQAPEAPAPEVQAPEAQGRQEERAPVIGESSLLPFSGRNAKGERGEEMEFVATPRNEEEQEIPVSFAIVELDQLTTSHDIHGKENEAYDQSIQPRDRERANTQAVVIDRAGKLDPPRLDGSRVSSDGSPIVGPDGQVESGNGRVLSIGHAYATESAQPDGGKGTKYRRYVEARAKAAGMAGVENMKQPVLVRVRGPNDKAGNPIDRKKFARQSNVQGLEVFSPVEQAKKDFHTFEDIWQNFEPDADTEPSSIVRGRNHGAFLSAFVQNISSVEYGTITDDKGNFSDGAIERISNAMLWAAYRDEQLLSHQAEGVARTDIGKNVMRALESASPLFAKARSLEKDGEGAAGRLASAFAVAIHMMAEVRRADDARTVNDLSGEIVRDPYREVAFRLAQRLEDLGTRPKMEAFVRDLANVVLENARKQASGVSSMFEDADLGLVELVDRETRELSEWKGRPSEKDFVDAAQKANAAQQAEPDLAAADPAPATDQSPPAQQADPAAPTPEELLAIADQSPNSPNNDQRESTPAQNEAENYRKPTFTYHGMTVAIETPKDGTRRGGKEGNEWSVKMPAHYGYVKRTEGADGDAVDVYVGDDLEGAEIVFVVDQKDAESGDFDEHKAFVGFDNVEQVRATYRRGFSDGRGDDRMGEITEMPIAQFKEWVANRSETKKPASERPPGAIGKDAEPAAGQPSQRGGDQTEPTGERDAGPTGATQPGRDEQAGGPAEVAPNPTPPRGGDDAGGDGSGGRAEAEAKGPQPGRTSGGEGTAPARSGRQKAGDAQPQKRQAVETKGKSKKAKEDGDVGSPWAARPMEESYLLRELKSRRPLKRSVEDQPADAPGKWSDGKSAILIFKKHVVRTKSEPDRPLAYDHVSVAVVGHKTSEKLRQALRDRGIEVRVAPEGISDADLARLQSPEKILFAGKSDAFPQPERPKRGAKTLTVDEVQEVVDEITDGWNDGPPIRVIDTLDDLRAEDAERVRNRGGARAEGFFERGEIVLVASRLPNKRRAQEVLAHEAIGHFGIERMLGDKLGPILKDVFALAERDKEVGEIKTAIEASYKDPDADTIAKEIIAKMAERGVRNPVMTRVLAAIRRFLRSVGFDIDFSRRDIEAMLVRAAETMHVTPKARAAAKAREQAQADAGAPVPQMSIPEQFAGPGAVMASMAKWYTSHAGQTVSRKQINGEVIQSLKKQMDKAVEGKGGGLKERLAYKAAVKALEMVKPGKKVEVDKFFEAIDSLLIYPRSLEMDIPEYQNFINDLDGTVADYVFETKDLYGHELQGRGHHGGKTYVRVVSDGNEIAELQNWQSSLRPGEVLDRKKYIPIYPRDDGFSVPIKGEGRVSFVGYVINGGKVGIKVSLPGRLDDHDMFEASALDNIILLSRAEKKAVHALYEIAIKNPFRDDVVHEIWKALDLSSVPETDRPSPYIREAALYANANWARQSAIAIVRRLKGEGIRWVGVPTVKRGGEIQFGKNTTLKRLVANHPEFQHFELNPGEKNDSGEWVTVVNDGTDYIQVEPDYFGFDNVVEFIHEALTNSKTSGFLSAFEESGQDAGALWESGISKEMVAKELEKAKANHGHAWNDEAVDWTIVDGAIADPYMRYDPDTQSQYLEVSDGYEAHLGPGGETELSKPIAEQYRSLFPNTLKNLGFRVMNGKEAKAAGFKHPQRKEGSYNWIDLDQDDKKVAAVTGPRQPILFSIPPPKAAMGKDGKYDADLDPRLAETEVSDAYGRPELVFHGSPTGRDLLDSGHFDPDLLASRTGAWSARKAFFFTDSERVASTYASPFFDVAQGDSPFRKTDYMRMQAAEEKLEWLDDPGALDVGVRKDADGDWIGTYRLIDSYGADYRVDGVDWFETEQEARDGLEEELERERARLRAEIDEYGARFNAALEAAHAKAATIPVYLDIKNPKVVNGWDRDTGGPERKGMEDLVVDAIKEGRDGLIVYDADDARIDPDELESDERPDYIATHYAVFRPEQIINGVTGETMAKDPPKPLFSIPTKPSGPPDPPLRATHNLQERAVLAALKAGRLLAPSVAVQPADQPHDWGQHSGRSISLVLKPGALNFRRDNVAVGDSWTPTHPVTKWRFPKRGGADRLIEAISQALVRLPPGLRRTDPSAFRSKNTIEVQPFDLRHTLFDSGDALDINSDEAVGLLARLYLVNKGRKTISVPSESTVFWELKQASLEPAYEDFVRGFVARALGADALQVAVRDGFTGNGHARYIPATDANVLKLMRRAARERHAFGFAELVGRHRPTVRSVRQAREAAGSVGVRTEAHKRQWERLQDEFGTVLFDDLKAGRWERVNDIMTAFGTYGVGSPRAIRAIKEWTDIDVSADAARRLREIMDEALALPVRYLEAKPMRVVPMADVALAVVQPGVSIETRRALRDNGIKVRVARANMKPEDSARILSPSDILFSNPTRPLKPSDEGQGGKGGKWDRPLGAPPDGGRRKKRRFEWLRSPIDRLFALPFRLTLAYDKNWETRWMRVALDRLGRAVNHRPEVAQGSEPGLPMQFIDYFRVNFMDRFGMDPELKQKTRQARRDKEFVDNVLLEFLVRLQDADINAHDARILNEIVTGERPSGDARTPELSQLTKEVRAVLDELGQQMVTLGLLDPAVQKKNDGKWLHRSYMIHEQLHGTGLGRAFLKGAAKGRHALIAHELKKRGVDGTVPRKRLLRDVPVKLHSAAAAAPQWRVHVKLRADGSVGSRLYWPADKDGNELFGGGLSPELFDKGGWYEYGIWEVRNRTGDKENPVFHLYRDYSREEMENMGLITNVKYNLIKSFLLLSHDTAQGKYFRDISQNPNWALPDGQNEPYPYGWEQVPKDNIAKTKVPRWGALAGMWVDPAVMRELRYNQQALSPKMWTELIRLFKWSKTAGSVTTHVNNVMSNFIFMDLQGLAWRDLVLAAHAWANQEEGGYYREAEAMGVFGYGKAAQEIMREHTTPIMEEMLKHFEETGRQEDAGNLSLQQFLAALHKMQMIAHKVAKYPAQLYRFEDSIFRLAMYMRMKDTGRTPEQSAEAAISGFLDYDIQAPAINLLRRNVLPFLSYPYRAFPMIARQILLYPHKMLKYTAIGMAIMALPGLDEDEEERDREAMPDYLAGDTWIHGPWYNKNKGLHWTGVPRMIPTPWRDRNGARLYIDIYRYIPAGDIFETGQGQLGVPPWMQVSGPLMTAIEVAINKSNFTGREIWDSQLASPWEKTKKIVGYTYRSMAPSGIYSPGSWHWEKFWGAVRGERDSLERRYSAGIAFLNSFGVRLKPVEPDVQIGWKLERLGGEIRQRRYRIRNYETDRDRRKITQQQFNRLEAEQEAEIQLIEKEMDRLSAFE